MFATFVETVRNHLDADFFAAATALDALVEHASDELSLF
jgi:hypothetical protein